MHFCVSVETYQVYFQGGPFSTVINGLGVHLPRITTMINGPRQCPECDQHYIGETARTLGTRIKEHLSCRQPLSAISEHKLNTGHQCSMNYAGGPYFTVINGPGVHLQSAMLAHRNHQIFLEGEGGNWNLWVRDSDYYSVSSRPVTHIHTRPISGGFRGFT